MSEERKSIGAGKLSKVPDKRLRLTIGEGAVKTKHIADEAITPSKVSPDAVEYITADVQNQIDSIQIGGWAISNNLGNDPHIGISQKALTELIGYDDWPDTVRGRIKDIEDEIGSDTTGDTLSGRIKNVEEEIGTDTTSLPLSTRITSLEGAVGSGGSVDERIAVSKSQVVGSATANYNTLGKLESRIKEEATARINAVNTEATARDNAVSAESSRAQAAEQQLQDLYTALTQSDIVVGTLPASGTTNKIYRVPGTGSYSDYMWNGSEFVKMAEYDNAIDNLPTEDSENLAKSGGIAAMYGGYKEISEYAEVHTDSEDRYLYGVKPNGDFDWASGIPTHLEDYVHKNGYDSIISPESYVSILFDSQDNLINYRKQDGTLVECAGVESPVVSSEKYNFVGNALKDLEADLIADGFNPGSAAKKKLNILFIGSSSEQDYVSYVPPILSEVLYDYDITFGDTYISGGSADDYINMYKNDTPPITRFNYWSPETKAWTRRGEKLIESVLAVNNWDFIVFKGGVSYDRQLMRIIQSLIDYPTCFMTDAMVSRPAYNNGTENTNWTWQGIITSIKDTVRNCGFADYLPITTAIDNARSNSVLRRSGGVTIPEPTEFFIPANEYIVRYHRIRKASSVGASVFKASRVSEGGSVSVYAKKEISSEEEVLLFTVDSSEEVSYTFSQSDDYQYIKFVNTSGSDCTIVLEDSKTTGNYMHYSDNQHLQSGLPTLIAGYLVSLKILEWTGNKHRSINACSFIPTDREIVRINAGDNHLGHGDSCGLVNYIDANGNYYDRNELEKYGSKYYVTSTIFNNTIDERTVEAWVNYVDSQGTRYTASELVEIGGTLYVISSLSGGVPDENSIIATEDIKKVNLFAAQEVAVMAAKFPDELTDCSAFTIAIPQKN